MESAKPTRGQMDGVSSSFPNEGHEANKSSKTIDHHHLAIIQPQNSKRKRRTTSLWSMISYSFLKII